MIDAIGTVLLSGAAGLIMGVLIMGYRRTPKEVKPPPPPACTHRQLRLDGIATLHEYTSAYGYEDNVYVNMYCVECGDGVRMKTPLTKTMNDANLKAKVGPWLEAKGYLFDETSDTYLGK